MLYTGDYSREEDRHLKAAEIPELSPDVCVIESTYGVQSHQPRRERETRFTEVLPRAASHCFALAASLPTLPAAGPGQGVWFPTDSD